MSGAAEKRIVGSLVEQVQRVLARRRSTKNIIELIASVNALAATRAPRGISVVLDAWAYLRDAEARTAIEPALRQFSSTDLAKAVLQPRGNNAFVDVDLIVTLKLEKAVPFLVEGLTSSDDSLARSCLSALAEFDDRRAVPALIKLAASRAAPRSVAGARAKQARDLLQQRFRDDPRVRKALREAKGRTRTAAESARTRWDAVRLSVEQRPHALIELIQTPTPPGQTIRGFFDRLIEQRDDRAYVEVALQHLGDANAAVRWMCFVFVDKAVIARRRAHAELLSAGEQRLVARLLADASLPLNDLRIPGGSGRLRAANLLLTARASAHVVALQRFSSQLSGATQSAFERRLSALSSKKR